MRYGADHKQKTRERVLAEAAKAIREEGSQGVSVAGVMARAGLTHGAFYAHFGSREELQISVVREYHDRFEDEVFRPALREPRGLPRLRAMFDRWLRRAVVALLE